MDGENKINSYKEILLQLSQREGEVYRLVATGYKNEEIAEKLHISKRTVENHRYRICKKLGLKGKGSLKKLAKKHL